MLLPQNPKVIIIDDKYEDAKWLLQLFSKNGIPYLYFDGDKESLPQTPFSSIRIVFSDINIRDNEIANSNTASELVSLLEKLIDAQNTMFLLVFWTKNSPVIPEVKKYLDLTKIKPLKIINIDKPTQDEFEEMTIEKMSSLINSRLGKLDTYEFLNYWENLISSKSIMYSNKLSDIITFNSVEQKIDWDSSGIDIFSALACTYKGTNDLDFTNQELNLSYTKNYINSSFANSLSNEKINGMNIFSLNKDYQISLKTIAKLNSSLFFSNVISNKVANGLLFNYSDFELEKLLINNIFTDDVPSEMVLKLVGLVLTPACDIAHPRFLTNGEDGYHRILYGILFNLEDSDSNYKLFLKYFKNSKSTQEKIMKLEGIDKKILKNIKKAVRPNTPAELFITQPFFDNGKVSTIIFHFGSICTRRIIENQTDFIYQLNENLVFDIQTKLANHINRLGNSMIEL